MAAAAAGGPGPAEPFPAARLQPGMTRLLIIGGVAGGATAAARARRLDEAAEITVLERGPYVSYANCGLPYFIGRRHREALRASSCRRRRGSTPATASRSR